MKNKFEIGELVKLEIREPVYDPHDYIKLSRYDQLGIILNVEKDPYDNIIWYTIYWSKLNEIDRFSSDSDLMECIKKT
jgi:hypothetical protein